MDEANQSSPSPNKKKFSLSIDFRLLSALLLAAIIGMILVWRPWVETTPANARTIEVSGEATLKDTPDEFTFNPNYQFKGANKADAIDQVAKKSAEVVAGLKAVGVAETSIKTDSSGYEDYEFNGAKAGTYTYSLYMTINITDQKLVQKVQNYLNATEPLGSVSPFATFSEAKRKLLESKGRNLAIADARKKADQTANELGFEVDKVKTISDTGDQGGMGIPQPFESSVKSLAVDGTAPRTQLGVQSGENSLSYRVNVSYYIK